jgi:hypothetical protein
MKLKPVTLILVQFLEDTRSGLNGVLALEHVEMELTQEHAHVPILFLNSEAPPVWNRTLDQQKKLRDAKL